MKAFSINFKRFSLKQIEQFFMEGESANLKEHVIFIAQHFDWVFCVLSKWLDGWIG